MMQTPCLRPSPIALRKAPVHWQAREEYLSDIKQDKNQTTAKLDIYIKDLIRRCQFPPEDQESRKIDLLYHATAHFEVRKFVHNAKQVELKYRLYDRGGQSPRKDLPRVPDPQASSLNGKPQ